MALLVIVALPCGARAQWALAEGGNIVTNYVDGDGMEWRAHIFTDVGTTNLHVTQAGLIEYLIVGGGGSGAVGGSWSARGGNGGAVVEDTFPAAVESCSVIIGAGGATVGGGSSGSAGQAGDSSEIFGSVATGGAGASLPTSTDPVHGGDGAGGAASTRDGGPGVESGITGTSVRYGGGGGAANGDDTIGTGTDGGGDGNIGESAFAGIDGRGGGGGGARDDFPLSGAGGSGIVVVRYQLGQQPMLITHDDSAIVSGFDDELPRTDINVPISREYVITNTSSEASFTLTNSPNAVVFSNGETSHNGFTVSSIPGDTEVGPGETEPFTITFLSAESGIFTETVFIGNNVEDQDPYTFSLKATVLSEPEVGTNTGVDVQSATQAILRGELTSGFLADAYIVWGDEAGDPQSADGWQHVVPFGEIEEGDTFETTASDLLYGQKYHYMVYATNAFDEGSSAVSPVVDFFTEPPETLSITNLGPSDITATSATLEGELHAPDSVFTVTAYWSDEDPADWDAAVDAGTASSDDLGSLTDVSDHALRVPITNLLADTQYYFTFSATNAAETLWTETESFTTLLDQPEMAVLVGDTLVETGGEQQLLVKAGEPLTKTFTITNIMDTKYGDLELTGSPDAVVLDEAGAAAGFSVTNNLAEGTTIPPGGSASFTIHFENADMGTFSAEVSIGSNDPENLLYTFDVVVQTVGWGQAEGGIVTNYVANGMTWRAHVFTNVGASVEGLTVTQTGAFEYLIVGGGGAGGSGSRFTAGAGGGGGEVKLGITALPASLEPVHVFVGAGGVASTSGSIRRSGEDSLFGLIVAAGGGGGGIGEGGANQGGLDGGSGGGSTTTGTFQEGGASTATGGGLGHAGGGARWGSNFSARGGGGGGGAGGAGAEVQGNTMVGGNGGAAVEVLITGQPIWVGGGGGGGARAGSDIGEGGENAGDGSNVLGTPGGSGIANRGGGGGGGTSDGSTTTRRAGGSGGSGIVVVRYRVPTATLIILH